WAWVRYHDAQLSFPLPSDKVTVQAGTSGFVVLDSDSPTFTSDSVCLGPPGTMVCLLPLDHRPSTYASEKPTVLNGVPVYLGPTGDYYVPSLGVQIAASGPLARRIVDTLSRNPMPGCANPNSWGRVHHGFPDRFSHGGGNDSARGSSTGSGSSPLAWLR
ncbi:MAG: hypothetical protein ABSG36_15660, partial [Acidimicrobiales bacterium]